jgi:hypothetical protein
VRNSAVGEEHMGLDRILVWKESGFEGEIRIDFRLE